MTALLGLAGTAEALSEAPQDIRYQVVHGQRDWTVRWQARAYAKGGLYRLYAGQSQESLRLVNVQEAVRGTGSYQYSDGPSGATQVYYQLRYVAPGGEERVVGTLRLDLQGVEPLPVSIELEGPGLKALNEVGTFGWDPPERLVSLAGDVIPTAHRPRPEVPPPRTVGPAYVSGTQ